MREDLPVILIFGKIIIATISWVVLYSIYNTDPQFPSFFAIILSVSFMPGNVICYLALLASYKITAILYILIAYCLLKFLEYTRAKIVGMVLFFFLSIATFIGTSYLLLTSGMLNTSNNITLLYLAALLCIDFASIKLLFMTRIPLIYP